MNVLKPLCLLLLAALTLPWGAYAGGRILSASVVEAVAAEPAAMRFVTAAPRPCRVATLPGSPCGPDLGLTSGAIEPGAVEGAVALRPEGPVALSSRAGDRILDPPRPS